MASGVVQSVARTFRLMEALAAADGTLGVSELATRTGLPAATIHRLLATLVTEGYVRHEPASRRYSLGSALLRFTGPATRMLGAWAQPHLDELAELTGETANLAVIENDHVVYVAQAESRHMVRMFTVVGNRVSPHCTAVGKVLLAARPREEVAALLDRLVLEARTPQTITDALAFLAELDRVSEQGHAVDDEEAEAGVRCFAVGVGAPPIAALSISGPAGRVTHDRREETVAQMHDVAARMDARQP